MEKQVKITKGMIKGVQEGSCLVFKNIPYAKPPVKELRFKRPVEMDPWEGVMDCTTFGNITLQDLPGNEQPWEKLYYKEFYSDPKYLRKMSEDCLNLNIWTAPGARPEDKMPVAFWIHGGGFAGGYSSEIEFDGEAFVKQGVILVTVEYRCGVLGFLAHPWLSAEDDMGVSGNYGIFDQIAALNWVYDNIPVFGGDPDNITVFGQSAGCMSTQVLISSELTGDRIAKAILQSGVQVNSGILAAPTLKEEEAYGERIAEIAGVSSLDELRSIPAEKFLEAKRKFDMEILTTFIEQGMKGENWMKLVPNVDGYLLKDNVRAILKKGEIKKIPYMAGCVADDLGTTEEDRKEHIPGILLDECRDFCRNAYKAGCPDAFCYVFSRELPDENGTSVQAFHSAELWYMFGTLNRCWRPMKEQDQLLSQEMTAAWVNFMKTGMPMDEWRPCKGDLSEVKYFDRK